MGLISSCTLSNLLVSLLLSSVGGTLSYVFKHLQRRSVEFSLAFFYYKLIFAFHKCLILLVTNCWCLIYLIKLLYKTILIEILLHFSGHYFWYIMLVIIFRRLSNETSKFSPITTVLFNMYCTRIVMIEIEETNTCIWQSPEPICSVFHSISTTSKSHQM